MIVCSVSSYSAYADNDSIYLGGIPAGFTLSTRGAHVVSICDVITKDGLKSPAKDAGIQSGDIILKIGGNEINNAKDIELSVKTIDVKEVEYIRNGESFKTKIYPVNDLNNNPKIGVFIKDSVSGIGTVTFFKGGYFASLGHAVIDDNKETLKILGGNLYSCNITGVVKGEKGSAGELRGVFLRTKPIAYIEKNLNCGVYGKLCGDYDYNKFEKIEVGEAKIGEAMIKTTICGKDSKFYDISIIKSDYFGENKNFVIKINDQELLENTGGIVQGMSGSPIIQDGKLVGAVTHVFINDPTRGFGISIDNMLKHV